MFLLHALVNKRLHIHAGSDSLSNRQSSLVRKYIELHNTLYQKPEGAEIYVQFCDVEVEAKHGVHKMTVIAVLQTVRCCRVQFYCTIVVLRSCQV